MDDGKMKVNDGASLGIFTESPIDGIIILLILWAVQSPNKPSLFGTFWIFCILWWIGYDDHMVISPFVRPWIYKNPPSETPPISLFMTYLLINTSPSNINHITTWPNTNLNSTYKKNRASSFWFSHRASSKSSNHHQIPLQITTESKGRLRNWRMTSTTTKPTPTPITPIPNPSKSSTIEWRKWIFDGS